MITKEEFVSYIKELKRLNTITIKISSAMEELSPDFGGLSFDAYESLLVKMLSNIFKDKSDWIGYWIYELDWGINYKKGCVTLDDKPIKLKTEEDLYDILTIKKEIK